jgi:hypothetical protein
VITKSLNQKTTNHKNTRYGKHGEASVAFQNKLL